jgi:hypothetical protein
MKSLARRCQIWVRYGIDIMQSMLGVGAVCFGPKGSGRGAEILASQNATDLEPYSYFLPRSQRVRADTPRPLKTVVMTGNTMILNIRPPANAIEMDLWSAATCVK